MDLDENTGAPTDTNAKTSSDDDNDNLLSTSVQKDFQELERLNTIFIATAADELHTSEVYMQATQARTGDRGITTPNNGRGEGVVDVGPFDDESLEDALERFMNHHCDCDSENVHHNDSGNGHDDMDLDHDHRESPSPGLLKPKALYSVFVCAMVLGHDDN